MTLDGVRVLMLGAPGSGKGTQGARSDDTESTIRHRIDVYTAQTLPLADYYGERRILCRVDATGTIEEVTARVFDAIDEQLATS